MIVYTFSTFYSFFWFQAHPFHAILWFYNGSSGGDALVHCQSFFCCEECDVPLNGFFLTLGSTCGPFYVFIDTLLHFFCFFKNLTVLSCIKITINYYIYRPLHMSHKVFIFFLLTKSVLLQVCVSLNVHH